MGKKYKCRCKMQARMKVNGLPRDCEDATWNAADLVCLKRPFSNVGGTCPLKCDGDKRSKKQGKIFKYLKLKIKMIFK